MKAAKTSLNVLLTGESGTGKELFAQAIHNSGPRSDGPFIAINCGAIPENLLASELFGYSEGAFTGAKKGGNRGKFESAHRGTIFLDEIGEMPLDMQVSLLRVLEEKRITRIGGREAIPVDVRIIAATNKDLAREADARRFRSDLYYRLNVITIELPPLRERKEDIPLLVEEITRKIALAQDKKVYRIAPDFIEICLAYHWPGNVRELQNVLEKAISLSDEPSLSLLSFPYPVRSIISEKRPPESIEMKTPLRDASRNVERDLILSMVAKHSGNKSRAAEELGISRSSLYRKLL